MAATTKSNPTPHASPFSGADAAPGLSRRERFLRACSAQPVDVPPVWLMRQAGRVLPEYRALKERHSFLELVRTPELAAEVTLQPLRRFGFDAAIIFSDILVIPEALGQPYDFPGAGGVVLEFPLRTAADLDRLSPAGVPDRLGYVAAALRLVKAQLGGSAALIGFSGSPWTLANFMIEGRSSRDFQAARHLLAHDPAVFERLARLLTDAIVDYLRLQVAAGADAIQLFDTLGGLLSAADYEAGSGRWLREIVQALAGTVPVIVFSKGAKASPAELAATGANVLGFDHLADLHQLRRELPARVAIQGNLDPAILETTPETVARETRRVLEALRGRPGHVFNLGHGVPPGAPLANLETLVQTVRNAP